MSKKEKKFRPKPELAHGFRDISGTYLSHRQEAIQKLSEIYALFGFEALETPVLEYAESLGKYLPDVDRPAGGVFGFQDDDQQWLAMRYDLTAPLARYVAKNVQSLPKPFKRYQTGSVFRNEKPGPGRFREFTQFDADIVGTANIAADAELCLMVSKGLLSLGLSANDVKININNRKLLSAVLEIAGLSGDDEEITKKRGIALRAIDKLDRLGLDGVRLLLSDGRKDASGDFTEGAKLSQSQIDPILAFTQAKGANNTETLNNLREIVQQTEIGLEGINELEQMIEILDQLSEYSHFILDPATIRGLGYYTGPVFEAELTFEVPNDKGQIVQFGSVAGGGRYDGLIQRFTGQEIPAVGVSIGLDRLLSALSAKDLLQEKIQDAPVLITVMDKYQQINYMKIAQVLRDHGIKTDLYVGEAGMKAQMKYADKRAASVAIIQGSEERDQNQVMVKDLRYRERYGDNQPEGIEQQVQCDVSQMVDIVQEFLKRN